MVREYQVIGRKAGVEEGKPNPLYRMRIFAPNKIVAKSRFWYFLTKLKKIKRAHGEILAVNEITEKFPNVIKNFGIFLRYNSVHGTHNIYKEFRDVSRCGAVKQLYADMASHHRATGTNIQIISVNEIRIKDAKRKSTKLFHNAHIRFPVFHRVPRLNKRFQHTFMPIRPTTF